MGFGCQQGDLASERIRAQYSRIEVEAVFRVAEFKANCRPSNAKSTQSMSLYAAMRLAV